MLSEVQLLTLAQTAQRQGLTRERAFEVVRLHTGRSRWRRIWEVARDVETAFPPLNVVGPGVR